MKYRQGFVSNSSTTSFLIYGALVDPPYDEEREEQDEYYDAHEEMWDKSEEAGLECHSTPWSGDCYVGLSWSDVRDDETGAQFKARVEAKLFELFGVKPDDCRTHEHAWRDG